MFRTYEEKSIHTQREREAQTQAHIHEPNIEQSNKRFVNMKTEHATSVQTITHTHVPIAKKRVERQKARERERRGEKKTIIVYST